METEQRLSPERRRELQTIIAVARQSATLTAETVMAYAELLLVDDAGVPIAPATHHRLWLELLCDWSIRKLLILAPPESAKTTWVVSAYLGCRIGLFPEQNVILGSATGPIAEKRSLSLRAMVTTPDWQALFPDVLPDKRMSWEQTNWSLAYGGASHPGRLHPTVSAYGTGGSITGSRGDELVADDLLDFENSRTPGGRALVEAWTHNTFLPRRKSGSGRVVMIGTAWPGGTIYDKAKTEGDWVVCHTPLLSEDERVYALVTYPDGYEGRTLGEPVGMA